MVWVLLALAAFFAWLALRPPTLFLLRIADGRVRVARGKVAGPMFDEARHICADARLTHGWVRGSRTRRGIVLTFSRHIPPDVRQRFRNVWLLFG